MPRRFDPVHLGSPRFRTASAGRFLVTDAWFPASLTLPPHEHERAVVAVTLDGSWDSVMLRRPYVCAPATLLVEPAGERHSNHFGAAGGRVLVVQPDLSRSSELQPLATGLVAPLAVGCARAADVARRLRLEIDAPDSISELAIEALAIELLILAARRPGRAPRGRPRWLATVLEYLHAHAREPLTLADVARVAGVHPAHLAREFRRHHGTSVAAYIRDLRLAWAAACLTRGGEAIADIAAAAGYADQSHFTRAFRAWSGRTPRAYRDRASTA